MHPFDAMRCPSAFIEKQLTLDSFQGWEQLFERPSLSLPSWSVSNFTRENYFTSATSLIEALRRGDAYKAVLSRIISVQALSAQSAPEWFIRLLDTYPTAFVFLVYIPECTAWMGASPELLLHYDDKGISTYSLAATKLCDDTTSWSNKELEEQRIVTDYIERVITHSMGKKPILSELYEQVAGKVKHLCTHISLSASLHRESLDILLQNLHPTPAVGGFPRDKALSLISQIEPHSRRYYAGYVGLSSGNNSCDLYVNLRSMELLSDRVDLYVGGGLTARSVAADEWKETCIKASTMLDVITT